MPNAIKWDATPTSVTVFDRGATIADSVLDTFDTTNNYDNSTNLNTLAYFRLQMDTGNMFSSAVTQNGAAVLLYRLLEQDSVWDDEPDASGDHPEYPHLRMGHFPIPTAVVDRPITIGPIELPPFNMRFSLFNFTGQTLQSGVEVVMLPYNVEVQ